MRHNGQHFLAALEHAYADAQELQQWKAIPAAFPAHLETFDRIEHVEALLLGATALILQMSGWLAHLRFFSRAHLAMTFATLRASVLSSRANATRFLRVAPDSMGKAS
ncbi:hypothetical protein [Duganella levis]|uniref:Uncharacterized protein n=1 Tax=Duganella levis TaxID=2692169 RepID=A0ABW9VT54_9BURK|nr:hypothetical protein [Duganella levis]MYN24814.1 hypothetical protein [Duganella levis]